LFFPLDRSLVATADFGFHTAMLADGRILLIRLGKLGDIVFTLPAVQAIRAAFPQARLTFLVYAELAPLLQGFGELDFLVLDRAGYRKLDPRVVLGGTVSLFRRLVRSRFELAVDFQGFGETALLTWLSRAPQRWGNVYRPSRRWAYTRPIPRPADLHPVQYNLELLRRAGGVPPAPELQPFRVPHPALGLARGFCSEHGLDPERATLMLQPFTSSPEKEWPLDRYIELAQRARAAGFQVLFSGGPKDAPALERAAQSGFVVSAGVPLLVSAALANLSTLVVGGDTGLLHLAVAMGKRVLMLIGSLEPGACHPFAHPNWTVLPASGQPVASIPVESVWKGCAEALAQTGAALSRPRRA
jgi:ADP-heptose:LPS heptosyltransferase